MNPIPNSQPDLDTLLGLQGRAVDLTGIAQALDILAAEVNDSTGLRFDFVVLARLVLERGTELDCALDRLTIRDL